jgi:RimJ/RimL family protein N-acetyltransferase
MPLRPPDPPLRDDLVALRPWTDRDVDAVVAACQDPEIAKWIPMVPTPYTRSDARDYLRSVKEGWREGTGAAFAILDAASTQVLGSIGLHIHRSERRASVGYWLSREARGRGVATRALRLVSAWALDALGIERLELIAEPINTASCAVAERAGFTREGVLRAYLPTRTRGRRDVVMFSLLPDDRARP